MDVQQMIANALREKFKNVQSPRVSLEPSQFDASFDDDEFGGNDADHSEQQVHAVASNASSAALASKASNAQAVANQENLIN